MNNVKYPAFSPKQVSLDKRVRLNNLRKLTANQGDYRTPQYLALKDNIFKLGSDNLDKFTQAMEKRFPGGN